MLGADHDGMKVRLVGRHRSRRLAWGSTPTFGCTSTICATRERTSAPPGASIKDLMAHLGHSTQHAALIYQHANIARQKTMAALVSDAIEEAMGHVAGTADTEGDSDDPLSRPA